MLAWSVGRSVGLSVRRAERRVCCCIYSFYCGSAAAVCAPTAHHFGEGDSNTEKQQGRPRGRGPRFSLLRPPFSSPARGRESERKRRRRRGGMTAATAREGGRRNSRFPLMKDAVTAQQAGPPPTSPRALQFVPHSKYETSFTDYKIGKKTNISLFPSPIFNNGVGWSSVVAVAGLTSRRRRRRAIPHCKAGAARAGAAAVRPSSRAFGLERHFAGVKSVSQID